MGAYERRKGHQFERDMVNEFKKIGYDKAQRQLEYQEGFGYDLTGVGRYQPQLKRYKGYAPINKIEEVPAVEGKVPLLITKGDRMPVMVVIPWENFKELIKNESK